MGERKIKVDLKSLDTAENRHQAWQSVGTTGTGSTSKYSEKKKLTITLGKDTVSTGRHFLN